MGNYRPNFSALMLDALQSELWKGSQTTSIVLGETPWAGLTPFVNALFPDLSDDEKTLSGKLQRQVLESWGFRHDRYNVPTGVAGCQFKYGSTYVEPVVVENAA